jgi:tetratricopeptide (TPR) repeat protein
MYRKSLLISFILFAGSFLSAGASAAGVDAAVADIGHRWAKATYQTPEGAQAPAFEAVVDEAQKAMQEYPGNVGPMVWKAIALASAANAEGGLGALRKVKEARELLLKAEAIDPNALDGSIYCTLGSLYAKVPGWPLGYGDEGKAEKYFEKALFVNPTGIDPNYFYADFLADRGDYAKAVIYLEHALAAPMRPGREDADAGRRREALHMLATIRANHPDQLASNW